MTNTKGNFIAELFDSFIYRVLGNTDKTYIRNTKGQFSKKPSKFYGQLRREYGV